MRKGFMLIETVIISSVISIILICVTNLHIRAIEINRITKERDEAFNIARSVCEIYKGRNVVIPNDYTAFYVNDVYETYEEFLNSPMEGVSNNDLDFFIDKNYKKKDTV
ncbi:hypothetical protein SAMN05443428_104123 [Caloramator quimbayensis]|uniref:Uncharacterized protein n=1 Tax=Caloramator quimbayensis TaxID=1147123 RepID=A0A1T4WZ24_9CLOT|nr:hypothetical protein [Caloramator quimbayensis]SKA81831.1 hypothetical protein SAMN05443428_104123 [Caloramator quimbayensis]